MKREIRRMLTAVLFAAAILLLPEISVNVSAQENISGVIVNGQIVTGFVPGVSADAAAQAEGEEIAAETITEETETAEAAPVSVNQLAADAQAAADEFAAQAAAAQQELEQAREEARALTNSASTQEEIEAAAASAVRYLEAQAVAEDLSAKASQAADNAERARTELLPAQLQAAIALAEADAEDAALAEEQQTSFFPYVATPEEIRMLANLIFCEAANQPYEGKVAVASVVLNRMRSPKYANDMRTVIYQRWQFTPATTGWLDRAIAADSANEECYQAARDALAGVQPVGDAIHFMRKELHSGLRIADHCFWGAI